MSYQYPKVGAFYNGDNTTSFLVWAPERAHMEVVISNHSFPMERDERGYWKATIDDVLPGTRYLYRIDRKRTLPDPASCSQPEDVHGPSAVPDRNFSWSDDPWMGLHLADMIMYELHVGTFTPEGTFAGVIRQLPYLKTLGINAIELMPVAQFPGERNWGYDGVFPFAVQHSYGGAAGLKRLVNEAHKAGIGVILDVVYNHQGPEGNHFESYGPYFTDKYKTFWGKAINFDDAWCDGVRHFYLQNAAMWLHEFRLDGLRLDAVHAIWDFGAKHFIAELKKQSHDLQVKTGRIKVLIAELDLNHPRYISPPAKGGYGLDGQWTDEFHHALHALLTGETQGYYEDFGSPEHLCRSLKHSYVYTGQYSTHRKKHFGAVPEENPYSQFVVFAQNHDQVGNRLMGDRLSTALSFEGLKLAAAAFLLTPHVPMLFMGEEYGERNPFQYFISHHDEGLVEAVREGRKKEFSYFNWQGGIPDPQHEETFNGCKLSWDHQRSSGAAVLLSFYRHLISLRKTRQAMQGKERGGMNVFSEGRIIAFDRKAGGDHVLVALNFGTADAVFPQSFTRPLRKIFDSAAVKWNGPGEAFADDGSFVLKSESASVFEL